MTHTRVLARAAVIVTLYLAFSFVLFLGLQVRHLFGNSRLAVAAVQVAVYAYFGFVRKN